MKISRLLFHKTAKAAFIVAIISMGIVPAWAQAAENKAAKEAQHKESKENADNIEPVENTAPPQKTQPVLTLPTITTFADKRALPVQKTPIAMTVMDSVNLEDGDVKTLQRVYDRIPNLFFGTTVGNYVNMSFRGKTTASVTEANPIVVYMDGVPMDTYMGANPTLLNIERVEILRGSQSVMYGKNSMGGVINIVSKKPTNEFGIQAYSSAGSYDTYSLGGVVNGPILEDKLFFSLGAEDFRTGGYMKNNNSHKSNSDNTSRYKAQLRATPTDSLEINLMGDYMQQRKGIAPAIKGITPTLYTDANPDDRTRADAGNAALFIGQAMDWAKLELVSTFNQNSIDYTQDLTYLDYFGAGPSGRDVVQKEFSQEVRLRSPDGTEGINWTVGLYGSNKNKDRRKIYSTVPSYGLEYNFANEEKEKEYAAFGQIVFPIFQKLKLAMALRYQYTDKDIDYKQTMTVTAFGITSPLNTDSANKSWDGLMPRLTLSYEVTDDAMAYASVSRGFLPGGFNWTSSTADEDNIIFNEQTSWDYEVGVKTEWLNKRLMVNGNLFYSDIQDLQTITYDIITGNYLTGNAASATSYGAELEVMARLLPGLDFEVNAAVTKAKFDDYKGKDTSGPYDYSNNKVPLTPTYTANAALQYRHDSGVFVRGEVKHYAKLYWDDANSSSRSGITTADAKVGYEANNWSAYAYGTNIFDKRYLDYYSASSDMGLVAAPQEFGIRFEVNF